MSRALWILCACALAFAVVVAQEEEAPAAEEPIQGNENGFSLLIARRTFLNDSFVENREMTVRIDIWNLGTKEAENVVIEEKYPEDMFSAVEKKVFDKILATENVSFVYTVTPKSHGRTMIPRAHITYEDRVAYIDADLPLLVESPEEYAKRTDRHIIDWLVFTVASVLACCIPSFVLYKQDKQFK